MSDLEGAKEIAGLTPRQKEALLKAATLLGWFAGEGMGHEKNGETIWSDEVCLELSEAFLLDWEDDFSLAVRRILEEGNNGK